MARVVSRASVLLVALALACTCVRGQTGEEATARARRQFDTLFDDLASFSRRGDSRLPALRGPAAGADSGAAATGP